MQELGIGLRQLGALHEPRVVRLHEDVEPRADPLAVRRQRGRNERRVLGRAHLLQQPFAVQRFERRRIRLDDVDIVTAGLRFGQHSGEHLVGRGAPHVDFDPMPRLERAIERRHVFYR